MLTKNKTYTPFLDESHLRRGKGGQVMDCSEFFLCTISVPFDAGISWWTLNRNPKQNKQKNTKNTYFGRIK